MLDGYITDRVEAETLHFRQDYIDIYSGSWGPEDSGKLYEGPGILAQSAFQQGVVTVSLFGLVIINIVFLFIILYIFLKMCLIYIMTKIIGSNIE